MPVTGKRVASVDQVEGLPQCLLLQALINGSAQGHSLLRDRGAPQWLTISMAAPTHRTSAGGFERSGRQINGLVTDETQGNQNNDINRSDFIALFRHTIT
jgi:hypothetical protein